MRALDHGCTSCEQHTAPRALGTRNIFSRVAQDLLPQRTLCTVKCTVKKHCLSFSRIMSHPHSSVLDLPPSSHATLLTSLPLPSRGDHHHLIHGEQSAHTSEPPERRSCTSSFAGLELSKGTWCEARLESSVPLSPRDWSFRVMLVELCGDLHVPDSV